MKPAAFPAILALSLSPASLSAQEPKALWRFEGNLEDALGRHSGRSVPGPAAFVPGAGGGKALSLDGKRFVQVPPSPDLEFPETSVELWFKPAFQPGLRGNPALVAQRVDHAGTRFSLHVASDYSCLMLWNGRRLALFYPPLGPLHRGEWYFLAVTMTPGETRFYLDGLPCLEGPGRSRIRISGKGYPILFGAADPKGKERFRGALDEIAFYDRILTPGEIARHMDAGKVKKRLTFQEYLARKEADRKARAEEEKERLHELMDPAVLFGRGKQKVYRGESLEAIRFPLGGIGGGCVQVDGRAVPAVWQIAGNMTQAFLPDTFFALAWKAKNGGTGARALQAAPAPGFPPMKALTFRGEYPLGWYSFRDAGVPVRVEMKVFSPFIPLDPRDSALPAAVFRFTLENRGAAPVEAVLLGSQQNAVGWTGKTPVMGRTHPQYKGNRNQVLLEKGAAYLHMTAGRPRGDPGAGDMALAATGAGQFTGTASWTDAGKLRAALERGRLTGPLEAGPTPEEETLDGALAARVALGPGEKRTVTFILCWYFPNARGGAGAWGGQGVMYSRWWKDALDAARETVRRLEELDEKTTLYHDTLYASKLPRWLLDRIGSQAAVLKSRTVFWTRSGYFGGWEGCCPDSGCCPGNCNHVWHYAQAHARLFPSLARRMREQEFFYQKEDGAVPYRQPGAGAAFDGQCGVVLNSLREHTMCPDSSWLHRNWPHVKKAMDYIVARWDKDRDGMLAGPQWNTLDGYLGGRSSWLESLYLAALAAAERMALLEGDRASARAYRAIRTKGSAGVDRELFNGEYYFQVPGPRLYEDYGDGCHIDQVLGQWWARQLDLGWILPPDHVRSALSALFKYNFHPRMKGYRQIPRKFVADEDPGTQMITWPKGPPPPHHTKYAAEVMTGFEYAAAAAMIQAGLLRKGLCLAHAVALRYDGRLRKGLTPSRTASWGYSGNPFGDDECGKFYARAMSSWSLLLACQGFVYDGPAGLIGFLPRFFPEDHASFFSSAGGWGLYSRKKDRSGVVERIRVAYGSLRVRKLLFPAPGVGESPKVEVRLGKEKVGCGPALQGARFRIDLDRPVLVRPGRDLVVRIRG